MFRNIDNPNVMKSRKSIETPEELGEVLSILSHSHSRTVCYYFRHHTAEVATVDDLVQFIHEQNEHTTNGNRVKIHLHHATLPKLENAGFIDYDPGSETVRYQEPAILEARLEQIVEE
ncbi:hypothetical protein ACLI4Y_11280 [Natrialbaceae archaeon A-CW3]